MFSYNVKEITKKLQYTTSIFLLLKLQIVFKLQSLIRIVSMSKEFEEFLSLSEGKLNLICV